MRSQEPLLLSLQIEWSSLCLVVEQGLSYSHWDFEAATWYRSGSQWHRVSVGGP